MPSSELEVPLTHYPESLCVLCDHTVYYDPTEITQPGLGVGEEENVRRKQKPRHLKKVALRSTTGCKQPHNG